MWSFCWRNPHGKAVHTCKPFTLFKPTNGDEEIIVLTEYLRAYGVMKSVTLTGAGTTTIASPKSGGSILIGDIVVSAKKVAGTTMDIEFDDGADTEIIISPDTVNQSANLAWTPAGRVQGWRDAELKVVTVGSNTDATVTVTYIKLKESITFADWDLLR